MLATGRAQTLPVVFILLKSKREVAVMEQWISLIQEVTFPIFITFYLLYRIETKLEAIHTALVSLNNLANRE